MNLLKYRRAILKANGSILALIMIPNTAEYGKLRVANLVLAVRI